MLSKDETKFVCNWSEQNTNTHKIQTFDLKTRDILSSIYVQKNSPLIITNDNKNFAYIEGLFVKVCEIETGDLQMECKYCNEEYESVTPRAITLSVNGKYIAFGARFGRPAGARKTDVWKTHTRIGVINLDDGTYNNTEFKSKKAVDTLTFVKDDQKLIATTKERIFIYSVPGLTTLSQIKNAPPLYGAAALQHIPDHSVLMLGAAKDKVAKMLIFNYDTQTYDTSDSLILTSDEEEFAAVPFGIKSKDDLSCMLMGTATLGNSSKKISSLWVWDRTSDGGVKQIPIGRDQWKLASELTVTPDWEFAVLGWMNGDISIVHLKSGNECFEMPHAHGHCVHYASFINSNIYLMTLGLDHSLKVWSTKQLLTKARAKLKNSDVMPQSSEEDALSLGPPILEPQEQCLDAIAVDNYAVTASFVNEEGPKLWDLKNGVQNEELTKHYDQIFKKSLGDKRIMYKNRGHAHLELFGNTLVFSRKRRDAMTICVMVDITNPTIIAHEHFDDTFFSLVCYMPDKAVPGTLQSDPTFLLVKNGSLDTHDVHLNLKSSVQMPEITDDIPNIESSAGKKKLMLLRTGVTQDGKFFVLVNPTVPKAAGGKYADVIDLEEEKYIERAKVKYLPWRLLEDSFCFLVWQRDKSSSEIWGPSALVHMKSDMTYKGLLLSEKSCLSSDREYGYEVMRNHTVRVWKVEPLKKLHHLHGHIREITCGAFSQDNRYLVTGSQDNTVRMWSVEQGSQVCMFHMYGGVSSVVYDNTCSYIVVHFATGPQRKRAAILRIENLASSVK